MRVRFRSHPCLTALLGILVLNHGAGQSTAQNSPFIPAAGTSLAASNAKEPLQLAGISVVGKKTYVSLYDVEKQRSRWIAVGETAAGIEVVSCDVKNDRALVRVGGQSKVLTLRKSATGPAVAGATGMAVSADANAASIAASLTPPSVVAYAGPLPNTPSAVPPPSTAPLTEQAYQEREARMLVSDLLEIGVEQRKAYETKKAAAEEAAKKDLTPTAPDSTAK